MIAAALVSLAGGVGTGEAVDQAVGPPGPTTPGLDKIHAVALEPGVLLERADVTAPEHGSFDAGAVLIYYGDTTDAFGRDWQVVGDPAAWLRQESWYAIAAREEEIRSRSDKVSLLTGLPAPSQPLRQQLVEGSEAAIAAIAATRTPVPVAPDWWKRSVEIDAAYLPEFGETLGVRAYAVPPGVAEEAVALLGGRDALAPWPEDPGYGRLHIAPVLPLVHRFDGVGWVVGAAPVSLSPVIGVLGNPELMADPTKPAEATGLTVSCWTLVGALDPRRLPVGRLAAAPPAPERADTRLRRRTDHLLGLEDLTARLGSVALETMVAPRRVVPAAAPRGVQIEDNSQRQAVYLEQYLTPEVTEALRGRTVRLVVIARAVPQIDVAASATVGVEIDAGEVRETVSLQVGPLPTPIVLEVTLPEDVARVAVRLLALDRSIAVQERDAAIFERAQLTPVEWPLRLEPAALLLRRVRSVTYSPSRRYTRAALAISKRPTEELESAWQELANGEWTAGQQRSMLAGELTPGMSQREVRVAWGDPDDRQLVGGGVRRWDYADRSAAFDDDGLIAWTHHAVEQAPLAAQCPGQAPRPRYVQRR